MISVSRPAPPANFLIPVNGPISHPVTPIRRRKSCLISPLLHPPPPLYQVSYQHWSFDLLNSHIHLIFSTCTVATLVQTTITLTGLPAPPLPQQGGQSTTQNSPTSHSRSPQKSLLPTVKFKPLFRVNKTSCLSSSIFASLSVLSLEF